jgi:hypothetical protein
MKSPLQRGLTTATALGAILALASCKDDPAAKPPSSELKPAAASTVASADGLNLVSGAGRSKHFDAVASHLQIGGDIFGYIDIDGDVEKLADLARDFLKKAPAGELPPHIEKLDFTKVLSDLGLDGVEALGMSSYKNGDLYHNRAFVYVPAGRQGLLKVLGGDAGPFAAHSLAPADSDLVIEQTLNVKAVYEVVSKMVMHFGGEEGYAEFRSKMGEINPQIGLSMADLFGKLNTRLTMVGRVHPDKPLEIPDAPVKIPSFDFLVALDELGWLYEKVTGNMKAEMPADQVAQMFITGDGYEKIGLPPMPSPDMAIMQPVIHHDITNKRIYLASSQAFLDECLAGKTKLADSADFKSATAGLPAEGNGLSYVSSDLMKAVRGLYEEAVGSAEGGMGAQGTAFISLFAMAMPESDHGQAEVSVNEKDGIFLSSNSTASMKQGLVIGAASFLGAAGLTTFRASSQSFESEGAIRSFEVEEASEAPATAIEVEAVPAPPIVPAEPVPAPGDE